MALGVFADGVGELGIAGLEVGHQRQLADPHHEVGRDRRQRGLLVVVARRIEAGDRHGVRAMKVHDGAVLGPHVVDRAVQQRLLGRRVAADMLAVGIELGELCRIELAQRGVGRRHQPAVGDLHADIARGTGAEPARGKLGAERADRFARLGFAAHSRAKALVKKSGAPKLPDFSASSSGFLPTDAVHGTPGSISGPMRSAVMSSAPTTAPEVSPPATTRRPTPAATSPLANVAMVFSIAWLDFSTPYLACSAFTASGVSLAESRIGPLPSLSFAQARALSPTGSPRQIASVSSARCAPLKAAIWPSVAAEQEPASTAAAPPTLGKASAPDLCASRPRRR